MFVEELAEAMGPASTLTGESAQRPGDLRPADGGGDESDSCILLLIAVVAVDGDDEVGVLGEGMRVEPTDCGDGGAAEQAESARDYEETVNGRPASPSDEEGAQILEGLDALQPGAGCLHVHDGAVFHPGPVGRPDNPTYSDESGIGDEGLDDVQEGVRLQQRIGIDHADEFLVRGSKTGIDGVTSTPGAFLADDGDFAVAGGPDVADGSCVRRGGSEPRECAGEPEVVVEKLEGRIGGAVVDDDDADHGVAKVAEGVDGRDDAGFFVVRRDDDAHAGRLGALRTFGGGHGVARQTLWQDH
ncbi:MAG: hypothetical protein ABS64_14010 [Microbacterium sp. SCN 69-37]|nr:MAG: hypothetical protein ABS64_14010 [Microbacterium sp. SCN 69-37]